MPTYFKPLRRKIGVVTLGLACVFAALWIRSFRIGDQYAFSVVPHLYGISSRAGYIEFGRETRTIQDGDGLEENGITSTEWWGRVNNPTALDTTAPLPGLDLDRQQLLGFTSGAAHVEFLNYGRKSRIHKVGVAVSQSTIVIPLTILSAWLLLSKPREPKPKPTE